MRRWSERGWNKKGPTAVRRFERYVICLRSKVYALGKHYNGSITPTHQMTMPCAHRVKLTFLLMIKQSAWRHRPLTFFHPVDILTHAGWMRMLLVLWIVCRFIISFFLSVFFFTPSFPQDCCLCSLRGGALQRANNDKWVAVAILAMHPEGYFQSYERVDQKRYETSWE